MRTKLVVRRLPPSLTEASFIESISNWLPSIDVTTFINGKTAKSLAKDSVFSRAYLNFTNVDSLLDFVQCFNYRQFVDSTGLQYNAVVEFAPFQQLGRQPRRCDRRINTIEEDEDYLDFVKQLEGNNDVQDQTMVENSSVSRVSLADGLSSQQHTVKSTPLLDSIRAEKQKEQSKTRAKQESKKLQKQQVKDASNTNANSDSPPPQRFILKKASSSKAITTEAPSNASNQQQSEPKPPRKRNRKRKDKNSIPQPASSTPASNMLQKQDR